MNRLGKFISIAGIMQIILLFQIYSAEYDVSYTDINQLIKTSSINNPQCLLSYTLSNDKSPNLADTLKVNDSTSVTDSLQLNDSISINGSNQLNDTIASPVTVEKENESLKEEEKAEPVPSNWKRGGQTALNFSQISLSNWSAGGQNSASFNSYFNVFLNYQTPDDRLTWENTLDLAYGLINQEHRKTVKSDDKIDFSTKFGRRASETWFYSTLINFRTQMAPGYKSPGDTLKISNLMAPAYLNISIGMDHKFDDNINFYLSPLAGRITYVLDKELSESGSFGVEPGKNKRYEFGGFIRVQFRSTLMENISVNSRLELFSNYLDKPKNLNINLDTRINMQITRFISANLVIQMMYDENTSIKLADGTIIGPRLQLKQVFGLGLSYRF